MPRPSTVLVVFVVSLNLFAVALGPGFMGVYGDIGLQDNINPSDRIDKEAPQYGEDGLATGSGVGGTLFGMYNVLTQGVQGLFSNIFPALDMLVYSGFPPALAYQVFGPLMTFVIVFDALSYLRGWGL